MSGPAIVWLIVGLITTVAVSAMLIALVRHVIVLARALGRFQQEVSPIAQDIASAADRAATRAERVNADRPFGPSKGPAVR
ncbi:MAG: hypothetical protein ACXWYC_10640 [Actinomycetota bacterium]